MGVETALAQLVKARSRRREKPTRRDHITESRHFTTRDRDGVSVRGCSSDVVRVSASGTIVLPGSVNRTGNATVSDDEADVRM